VKRESKQTSPRSATRFERMRRLIAGFRSNTRANVMLMFAATLPVLITAIGGVVDYSMAMSVRTKLQSATDAATLAAVSVNSPIVATARNMTGDGAVANGSTYLTNLFQADAPAGYSTLAPTTATVTKTGNQITANLSYTGQVPTSFLKVVTRFFPGLANLSITATSKSTYNLPLYMDFYLMLDNTPSMGLPATQSDIDTLVNGTTGYASTGGKGCAFACHDIGTNQSNPNNSAFDNFYATAKSLNVTKRIDVMASATAQLMTTAQNTQTVPNQFRVAIYTFGTWGSTGPSDMAKQAANNYAPNLVYPTSLPPSSNLSAAGTAAAQIDLMTVNVNNENNDRGTNFDLMLPAISNVIPNPGTGQSATSRQAWVFFVSDGMADEVDPGNCSGNLISGQQRCIEPINAALCTAIKNRGIQIAVLYTTYLTLPSSGIGSDSWSTSNVMPYVSSVAPAMQSCASPGYYFEVNPTQGISDAMNKLFQKVVSTAHVSN
jgi:Flp pilus assembly protein TadG